jgi:lysozyme
MLVRMNYSKRLLDLLAEFEGNELRSYKDQGGTWTIGRGHTRGVGPGLTCIPQQSDVWAAEDLGFAVQAVNHLVTVVLTQNEFDALVDFEFNTGGLAGSTMLELLNAGKYHGAALEFDKWSHVKGKVVAGLLRRRQTETELFESS